MTLPERDLLTPGPEERKLLNRLRFWITGRWPDAVVGERLALEDRYAERLSEHFGERFGVRP